MKSEHQKNTIQIHGVEKITSRPHVNLFEIRYSDKKGRSRTWDCASRRPEAKCVSGRLDRPDAVVIASIHEELKKLVIIKEFRVPIGGFQYGFPAGLLEEHESIRETSVREMYEETGLEITRIHAISPPIYSSSGMTDESISMVYAECTGTPSNRWNESSEQIETLMVTPDEAGRMCADSQLIFDVKTWLVMTVFAKTGRLFYGA